jgi:hypothetical membrane protein
MAEMLMQDRRRAGFLLLIGGILFLLGFQLAEIYYPGYNVHDNTISDLGGGPEPSALIFNATVFLFGLFGMAAAYFLWRDGADRILPVVLVLSGLGAVGVALFHQDVVVPHNISALIAFLFGGLIPLLSYRLVGKPLGYISGVLGTISLVALILFASSIYLNLGHGGMERLILYPILAWIIGLGAILASHEKWTGRAIT